MYAWYTDLVLVLALTEAVPSIMFLALYRGRIFGRVPGFLRVVALVAISRSVARLMFSLMGGLSALLSPTAAPGREVGLWVMADLASGILLAIAVWMMFLLFVRYARSGEYRE